MYTPAAAPKVNDVSRNLLDVVIIIRPLAYIFKVTVVVELRGRVYALRYRSSVESGLNIIPVVRFTKLASLYSGSSFIADDANASDPMPAPIAPNRIPLDNLSAFLATFDEIMVALIF